MTDLAGRNAGPSSYPTDDADPPEIRGRRAREKETDAGIGPARRGPGGGSRAVRASGGRPLAESPLRRDESGGRAESDRSNAGSCL